MRVEFPAKKPVLKVELAVSVVPVTVLPVITFLVTVLPVGVFQDSVEVNA